MLVDFFALPSRRPLALTPIPTWQRGDEHQRLARGYPVTARARVFVLITARVHT
jgi:hypothetical protein